MSGSNLLHLVSFSKMRISTFIVFNILNILAIIVDGQTFTECGGSLVGPGGTISSPNYPSSYPNNARCNWTITAQANEIINLEFKTVDFDGYVDACPDYAVIYDGDSTRSPVIRQLCRYNTSTELATFFVRSTSNKVHVTFTSDAYNQRQGFLANYWTHACPSGTYGPQRCTQNCSCVVEHTLYCNNFNGSCTCKNGWTSPTCGTDVDECAHPLIEACPRNYHVCRNTIGGFDCDCQAGLVRNAITGACEANSSRPCTSACPGLCGKVTLQGQVTPTEQCYCPYNTKLVGGQCQACTGLTYGRNCERSCSTCNRTNTQRCDNVTGQCICLPGWSGSTCADDVNECALSGNLMVCRETTGNYYCVNTIGSYRCDCYQGFEKAANGTCVRAACSFILNASEGNITSPNYPNYYSSTTPCSWTITVAQGKSITLRFTSLYAYTYYDSFLHIFDGPNADAFLIGRYLSNNYDTLTIKSTGNAMHLKFNSSYSVYGRFYGLYTTNDYASGCKQLINATDEKQILKNPGYPTYVNNTVCYWAINAPIGYNVSLRFTEVSLDTQGKSFIKVYNPKSAILDVKGQFYGTTNPNPITSTDNNLYVLFQSDGSVAGKGFNATFLRCLPFYYGEERCTTPCNCVKNNTQYCDSFNGACTCYPGWQSATCAVDVNECLSNPCYLTEKCVNTMGSYRCIPDCDSNFTAVSGSISTIGFPNYVYKNASCKWRIQGSPGQVVTLSIKNQDFQLYEDGTCYYDSLNIYSVINATSTQIGKYCGRRIPLLIRTSGNIMEIQLKTNPYWTSNVGFSGVFYTHTCKEFTYGPTCQFSCGCDLSKTRFCDNTNGVCVCKPGWTGDTCSEDVNECNYNTCPTNEVCKNTPGNYSCECQLGFSRTATGQCQGNSLNCVTAKNKTCSHFCYRDTSGVLICTCPANMEIGAVENQCAVTLYPYGAEKGDSGLIKTNGNSQYVSKPIVFATKVPVGAGTETEAYVFSDGVIRFGGNTISSSYDLAVKNGFIIIAPYWATLDPTKGEVFYHLYESCEPTVFSESATVTSSPAKAKVMERAAQDVRNSNRFYDFKVKTVLVATWKNVQILSSVIKTNPPTGTFQAIYITGYRKESIGDQDFSDEETAYVYFLYPKGGMNIIALKNSDTTIGISAGPYANKIQVNQTTFDWVKNKNYNEVLTYEIGKISGPEQKCEKHVCKNSQLITNADYRNQISQLYACPCTLGLLGLQWSLYEKRGALKDIFCFVISPVAKRRVLQNNPRNKFCCYKWTQPSLTSDWMKWAESRQQASFIHNTPDAGHVLVGDPWWSLAANESLEAQRSCCKDGNVGKLCDRYNLLYPDNECSYDVTFVPAWLLGDPTIATLDNVTYLFNGRGEYIMMDVQSENFKLQARTDRAETSNGTLTNATVFSAFAAKEKEISHFQVELATSKKTMFLYVGGKNITENFYSSVDYRQSLETIEVFRDDSGNKTKVTVVFPCGVSFAIRIGYKSLELEMQVQKTLQGKTKGLLGNFNGNTKDEFTLPNGTVLRSNLTEREIFYNFANKYQVTQANSVFTYRDGKTAIDYQFPDFVPFFNDSATASQLQKAREVCKNGSDSCVFDFLATNDVNFAINTNNTIAQSVAVKNTLANSYPVLSVVSNPNYVNGRWLVQEGVANTLSFKAVDNDTDVLTYILVEGSSAVSLTQNGLLTYTPTVNTPVNVALRVKDSKDGFSPVMNLPITICPRCSGHGQCNKNITRETEYFGGLVRVLKCSCLPGYTGANCESELDACKDNPCFKGQTCTDLTAAQQGNREIGYVCGPCPSGYTNYSGRCIDVDECTSAGRCEHYCNNTDGGYECSCREGFVLNRTDSKSCLAKNCSNRCVTQNTLYCDEGVSQCVCKDGIKTPDCSVNVDKCLSKPCPANLMCVSTQTSYECLCLNGQHPINGICADCNRQLTEVSGKFMSSNYPINYPSNQFCTWTIISNDSKAFIVLNITEFVVEGCPYDYLEVYDGRDTNADLIGQYCTDAPGLVTSSGNSLTVTFTSDGSENFKGFIASYAIESQCKTLQCSHSCQIVSVNPRFEKCVCPEWMRLDTVSGTKCLEINACNTTVTSSSGLIVSPGYPQKYGANTTCYWTIPAKTNTFTKLSFLDIDMEGGSTCPYDSVKVYDGTSSSAPLLSLVCGGVLPQAITSTGKGVFIVFKSDESIAGRGFKLQYG